MLIFRAPFFVGTPPALTTISLPCGVRAVSAATRRDQPPLAAMEAFTVGEPKISIALRSGAVVRTALPLRANVVTPGNANVVRLVFGSELLFTTPTSEFPL